MILFFIIILGSIINAQIIQVNQDTLCHCSQLTYQDGCLQMGQICNWSDNQCSANPCSAIEQQQCIKSLNCSWTNGQCIDFKNCQSLSGNTMLACQSQNVQCFWIGSTNCTYISYINCSEIYEQQYCQYQGSSLCYWDENCSQLSSQFCTPERTLGACTWFYQTSQCINNSCEWQTNCQTALVTPTNLQLYQVCVKTNSIYCQSANATALTQENCLSQSMYTYSWKTQNSTAGVCQPCVNNTFNQLLNYLMGMMILQILI